MPNTMTILQRAKMALQISTNTLDNEISSLISSAVIDLGIAGVDNNITEQTTDPAVIQAIIAYVGYQFNLTHGSIDRSKAFKTSYDEMKAQMSMNSSYTIFAGGE